MQCLLKFNQMQFIMKERPLTLVQDNCGLAIEGREYAVDRILAAFRIFSLLLHLLIVNPDGMTMYTLSAVSHDVLCINSSAVSHVGLCVTPSAVSHDELCVPPLTVSHDGLCVPLSVVSPNSPSLSCLSP